MEESYNHKKIEVKIAEFWSKNDFFTPTIEPSKKPFTLFLVPPNASGPMHVGNALMVGLNDILARHYRAKGRPTLWIPMTDHGGYETEITFEKELEKIGKTKSDYSRKELFENISSFVGENNELIKNQIVRLGGSVDWTRFRYNMEKSCVDEIGRIFKKMINENLISRRPCMVNYCPTCTTVLSDIELKEKAEQQPLYFVKFDLVDESNSHVTLATSRPEFLFSVTHVLVHPEDKRYAHLIGKKLKNPVTGNAVAVIASKRKFDPKDNRPLSPFAQNYVKFDYEYSLLSNIPMPARNLIDWQGNMTERYPGMKTIEARKQEVAYLKEQGRIEKVESADGIPSLFCKKGHPIESIIMMTWSLDMDSENRSLKKEALAALEKEATLILPGWRKQELEKWLKIMRFWPIARQTAWGIKIPVWYDISDPAKFFVWFVDMGGQRQFGNLKSLLDQGFTLNDISEGLERIYTSDASTWTFDKEEGKHYLPETDTFDTWFSGQWASMILGPLESAEFSYFYPSDCLIIGHDLVRLSVARKMILNHYLTGRLPYKSVYFHGLLKGADGQKMSKSLGNAVTLEHYLEDFGADVTRMSMTHYTYSSDDFVLEDQTLAYFSEFTERLWRMGRIALIARQYAGALPITENLDTESANLISTLKNLVLNSDRQIERLQFSSAQFQVTDFLSNLENYASSLQKTEQKEAHLAVFLNVFKKYLALLHPFTPFITEELNINLSDSQKSLSCPQ